MAQTRKPRPTWFDIGRKEGREGKPERPPETTNQNTLYEYRKGWLEGRIDRVQAGEAKPEEIE